MEDPQALRELAMSLMLQNEEHRQAIAARAGLGKLDSPISDKKSLVFLAQSAQESNDETTQKESHGRLQGQGSISSTARGQDPRGIVGTV